MRSPFLFPLAVIAAAALLIAGYDLWLYLRCGHETTISVHLCELAQGRPLWCVGFGLVIGFVVGVHCGHFFWPLD